MMAMEPLQEVVIEEEREELLPSPTFDGRANTQSMVSIALSDMNEPAKVHGRMSTVFSNASLVDLSDHAVSSATSDSGSSRPSSSDGESADRVAEFKVPALPSPRKKTQGRSQHVRNKSSLQEPDMAALLARLELENNAIAKDPKSGIAAAGAHTGPGSAFEYRVRDTVCSSLSLVTIPEEALGMNLHDFWALVTKDYHAALDLLPTMTPLMIHKGVPDFLRSAVWVGVAEARDASLQTEFDSLCQRLQHEKPQNEHIINKDLGRCFPQHQLFKDADGEGQKMLGTLLKCYALYDTEIGYCQGMGFIAGVLLLNMPLKDAFCVFVKLMENHDLRTLYSTTLTGLHSRAYQIKKLINHISPNLLEHLSNLGFEMAYLSQWFMTAFATSCPLNILFRIYDVIFAEGADETIMRVALALILSNEHKLMAMKELEEVLQLLLGRKLWDPYTTEPDFLMDEIARLSNVVTPEELDRLHDQFAEQAASESGDNTVRALGFTSGFSGFKIFHHFRTPSSAKNALRSPSTSNLLETPGHRPRRSVSKRSTGARESLYGSTGESLFSTISTASSATMEFDKDADFMKSKRAEDRGLHEQVEGLLLALSEVQREAAETAEALRQENRRKESMAEIVLRLKDLVTQREQTQENVKRDRRKTMPSRTDVDHAESVLSGLRRKSIIINAAAKSAYMQNLGSTTPDVELQESLAKLCTMLEGPAEPQGRTTGAHDTSTPTFVTPGISPTGDADAYLRVGSGSHDLRQASISSFYGQAPGQSPMRDDASGDFWPASTIDYSPAMSTSTTVPTTHQPRKSSLGARDALRLNTHARPRSAATTSTNPEVDEAMLAELVNAKTREATAIQERDEMKSELDRFRKAQEASLAREADWTRRMAEMERLLAAQQLAMRAQEDMHAGEMERMRNAAASAAAKKARPAPLDVDFTPRGASVGGLSAGGSLWPTSSASSAVSSIEPVTPGRLQAPSAQEGGGGWGWFSKKGRSVSTGSAAA